MSIKVMVEINYCNFCFKVKSVFSPPYLFTPWSRVRLEKLTVFQLVKKFPVFYGTRMFITAVTNTCHLSLSWASSIQSTTPYPTFWRPNLVLSSHLRLCLQSALFPSGFRTKTLYTSLLSPIRIHAPSISFSSNWSPEKYWARRTNH